MLFALVKGNTFDCFSFCFVFFATYTGSVFLYDCRANEMVPVYLVVHGVFLIIAIIFGLLQTRSDKDKKKDSKKEKTPNEKCIELISTLIHVFLIAWFFYGKYRDSSVPPPSLCVEGNVN